MKETNYYMDSFCIMMEDINMVILNLMIAIAYYRIINGHELISPCEQICPDLKVIQATDALLDSLSEKLNCQFSHIERKDIYVHIYCSRMFDAKLLNFYPLPMAIYKVLLIHTDLTLAMMRIFILL